MIKVGKRENCNGCTACVAVCPVQCISMNTDDEGFLYAVANEDECIGCGLCDQTCPIINVDEKKYPIDVISAYNKDNEICFKSSSGGIFTLLAERILNDGGIVFGACFDDNWQVRIDYISEKKKLHKFRTSKYVQAIVGNSLTKAKDFLDNGYKVLYSGTPCQIAGLKHFLNKEYPNLFTVDVACHGVPSPMLWRRYLEEISETNLKDEPIRNINFRYKFTTWRGYRLVIKGDTKIYSVERWKEPYLQAFVKSYSIREACYDCVCKEGRSGSDLTIADFWGAEQIEPEFGNDSGLSLLLINTNKGQKLLPFNQMVYKKTDYNKAKLYNQGLSAQTVRPKGRDDFFKDMNSSERVVALMNHYAIHKLTFKEHLKRLYWRMRKRIS